MHLSTAIIIVFSVLAAAQLWVAVMRVVAKRRGHSAVPLLVGLVGRLGVCLHPDASVRALWWLPFLLDWGSVPLLVEVAAWRLSAVAKRKGSSDSPGG